MAQTLGHACALTVHVTDVLGPYAILTHILYSHWSEPWGNTDECPNMVSSPAGEERSIVSSMSGTTRDAIDTDITGPDGRTFKLIDTAGIRRRTAVAGALPTFSAKRALAPCSANVLLPEARSQTLGLSTITRELTGATQTPVVP